MSKNDTWLITGLGNPGKKYLGTRHNIGFMAIDKLGEYHDIAINKSMFKNSFGRGFINDSAAVLAQPVNYMNKSGPPVYQLARYFDIDFAHIVIIHDDMDLDAGKIRIKTKGGHGGHRGVKSIIDALGTDEFKRIRVGLGRPVPDAGVNEYNAADYVLEKFSKKEMKYYEKVLETVREAVEAIFEKGAMAAMNEFN